LDFLSSTKPREVFVFQVGVVQAGIHELYIDIQYSYLRPNALQLLKEARCFTRENGILQSQIISYGTNSFFLCPFVGTKELQSIKALFSCGMKDTLEIYSLFGGRHYLHITSGHSLKEVALLQFF